MHDDAKLTALDDRALAAVCGGHLARYLAKGVAVGGLFIAPSLVSRYLDDPNRPVAGLTAIGVSWGALAGWAGHVARKRGIF